MCVGAEGKMQPHREVKPEQPVVGMDLPTVQGHNHVFLEPISNDLCLNLGSMRLVLLKSKTTFCTKYYMWSTSITEAANPLSA